MRYINYIFTRNITIVVVFLLGNISLYVHASADLVFYTTAQQPTQADKV